jgi:uncharacterized membrane protein (UPF0136 family)
MLPAVVAIGLLADRTAASLRDPGATSLLILAASVTAVLIAAAVLRHYMRRRRSGDPG